MPLKRRGLAVNWQSLGYTNFLTTTGADGSVKLSAADAYSTFASGTAGWPTLLTQGVAVASTAPTAADALQLASCRPVVDTSVTPPNFRAASGPVTAPGSGASTTPLTPSDAACASATTALTTAVVDSSGACNSCSSAAYGSNGLQCEALCPACATAVTDYLGACSPTATPSLLAGTQANGTALILLAYASAGNDCKSLLLRYTELYKPGSCNTTFRAAVGAAPRGKGLFRQQCCRRNGTRAPWRLPQRVPLPARCHWTLCLGRVVQETLWHGLAWEHLGS
jgi:hypothetical protein